MVETHIFILEKYSMSNEIVLNGKTYVEKEASNDFKIIRTYSAGVFFGELIRRDGKEVELKNARRLWYWDGSASLSQMAIDGVSKPENCKFAKPISVILTETIEIISTTEKAQKSINGVAEWIQK
jgi:hypothetical protein